MGDDILNGKDTRELYSMFHQEYIIRAEYRMLQTENVQGIYVIPSYENSFVWFGVIFVRIGFYEGGIFRFTITLPDKFPNDEVPRLIFNSSVYHPAVDISTGEVNLNEVFPDWDKNRNHIWQILKYLNWIFHNLNVKAPSNNEASLLFKTNKKVFIEKVKDCVATSLDHVYDEPPTEDRHYISFQPHDPEIHEAAKNLMVKLSRNSEEVSPGISWMQPNSFQPFSKEENV